MLNQWQKSAHTKSTTIDGHAFWQLPLGGFGFVLVACEPKGEPYVIGRTTSEADLRELARLSRKLSIIESHAANIVNQMDDLRIDDDKALELPAGFLPLTQPESVDIDLSLVDEE